ncbi:hypothetical protein IMY05_004G0013200 [Salix suchowensis]|nr:hypothetical protein IMY05_004G0013200 [Salix suchowensis]
MQVRISFDDDKEQEVEVEENDTVLGLKHRLHDKLSLQPSAQELEFDGLINTPKSWEIILREVFVISVHVEITIGYLKEMLSVNYGLEFTRMKVGLSSVWNNDLHESSKIGAYNLRDRSILYAFEM